MNAKLSAQIMKRLKQSIVRCGIFSERCNRPIAYTSHVNATMSVSVAVCPSVCDGSALAHYS